MTRPPTISAADTYFTIIDKQTARAGHQCRVARRDTGSEVTFDSFRHTGFFVCPTFVASAARPVPRAEAARREKRMSAGVPLATIASNETLHAAKAGPRRMQAVIIVARRADRDDLGSRTSHVVGSCSKSPIMTESASSNTVGWNR